MDKDWGLLVPFGIDKNELNGLSLEESFTLGVEFSMFQSELSRTPSSFTTVIHESNKDRIQRMCWLNKRGSTVEPSQTHGWVLVKVNAVVSLVKSS